MAVTFDAVGPGSSGTQSGTSPLTWAHVCGASATLIIVDVSVDAASDDSAVSVAVTYGGQSLTSLQRWESGGAAQKVGFAQKFYLFSPPTGSNTVSVTVTGSGFDGITGGSKSYNGAALLGTVVKSDSAGSAVTSGSIVTSTLDTDSIVDALVVTGGDTVAFTAGTSRFNNGTGSGFSGAGSFSASATAPGTGGNVTVSWTMAADFFAAIAVEVRAQAGVSLPGVPRPQPGGRAWRSRFLRRQPPVIAISQDVVATAGLASATGSASSVAPATTMTPTPAQQLGGAAWKRHWRNPMVPWYRFQELPYITGLAGGGRGYFVDQFGNPRLVWGDAVWALCGNVGRWNGGNWQADYDTFLATRAAQGFTVLYGKPMGTLQSSNIDDNGGTFDSLFPFQGGAPTTGTAGANPSTGLTEPYWQRIDYYLASAKAKGITIFMNAVGYASDFQTGGSGPLANKSSAEFQAFGTSLGTRYKNQPNLIWMVADDYFGGADDALLNSFLTGLRAAGDAHLISIENMPESTSRNTLDASPSPTAWGTANAAFNWTYSYNQEYYGVERAYAEGGTAIPVIQGDGYFYQGGNAYFSQWDRSFRQAAWWSLAAGARGKVHGSESIWQWTSTALANSATDWFYAHNALVIRTVVEGLAGWQNLFPDLGSQLVIAGRGTRATPFSSGGGGGQYEPGFTSNYVAASITPDHSLALLYLPLATTITIDTSQLGPGFTATWIDPFTGATSSAGAGPTFNSTAKGNNSQSEPDWALVLQGPAVTPSSVVPPQPGSDYWRSRFRRSQQLTASPVTVTSDLQVNAGLATGTGAASSAGTGLTPPAPSGTGSAGAPGIGLAGGSATSSGVAQAPGVQLASGLASGSGTAQAGQAGNAANAGLAPGTGSASAAGVQLAPGVATGAGTAQSPQAGNAASASAALGTGASFAPGIGLTGGSATSSGVAQAPGVQLGTGLAGGSGTASSEGVGLTPGLASGTGTAFNPGTSIGGDLQVSAGLAAGTGTAFGPGIGLQGGSASSSGAAAAPGVQLTPALAHGTGSGQGASPVSAASATVATGTGTAQGPADGNATGAGLATGTGAVQGAARALTPALATAPATAQSPSLTVQVSAQAALALGQALNATAQGQAAVIKGSSTATSVTDPMMSTGAAVTQPSQGTASVSKASSSQSGVT